MNRTLFGRRRVHRRNSPPRTLATGKFRYRPVLDTFEDRTLLSGGSLAADPVLLSAPHGSRQGQPPPPPQGPCTVLDLQLGPLNLNLLGLQVELYGRDPSDPTVRDPVELLITADPSGGLLGQLLCGMPPSSTGNGVKPSLTALGDTVGQLLPQGLTGQAHQLDVSALHDLGGQHIPPPPQSTCTVLDLQLGPLNLNLLGLQVELFGRNPADPSARLPVALTVTANPDGGILGQLLCDLAMGMLPPGSKALANDLGALATTVTNVIPNLVSKADQLLTNAVQSLADGGGTTGTPPQAACTILDLQIGPLSLNLLGLQVELFGRNPDDPTARFPVELLATGHPDGGLLGQLLCGLAGGTVTTSTVSAVSYEGQLLNTTAQQTVGRFNNQVAAALDLLANYDGQPGGPPPQGPCTILDLQLGPLNLNLLGLQVELYGRDPSDPTARDPVELLVTADPSGGILGMLLCGMGQPPAQSGLGRVPDVLDAALMLVFDGGDVSGALHRLPGTPFLAPLGGSGINLDPILADGQLI